ncbi:hypothetical protein [Tateyamaria sp. SN6-1]|uniref:hypothetical protein n=1 Tax=Tateyamaria sp. SN6-1 TaxID=3092148 RepID=UPI0039F55CAB
MAAALALLALSACDDGTAAVGSQGILRSDTAAPGPQSTAPAFAGNVLRSACIDTQPDFDGASQALARIGGFVQSAKTGTFFHQRYDLSVKVVSGRCSMVAGASGSARQLKALGDLPAVEPGPTRAFGNRLYHSFFVTGSS